MNKILFKEDFKKPEEFGLYILEGVEQSFETVGDDVDERELSAAILSLAAFHIPQLINGGIPRVLLFIISVFGFRRNDDRVFVHYITILRYISQITGKETDDLIFEALKKEVSIFDVIETLKRESESGFINKIIDIILKLKPDENNA